jgi:O-antigen ligase
MCRWLDKTTAYILGWGLYACQGVFLPKGSILSQLLLFMLLFISLYYTYVANMRYRLPTYFIGLNILVAMFTVYGVYLMIQYNPADYIVKRDPFIYLKKIYMSLLPIYTFYVFFREKYIDEKKLYVLIFILVAFTSVEYFQNQKEQMIRAVLLGSNASEFTNNIGYLFLSLIPACVFLYKKPLIQYVILGYCVVFILMGMKRGAILIGLICLMWFLWNNVKNVNLRKKIGILSLSFFLCIVAFLFIQKQMNESLYFQKRVEQTLDGNSSGRDALYGTFLDYFCDKATPLQFAFGSGADATLKVSDNYAHNDWLEIAVNQGILGIMIYMLFWFLFARESLSKSYSHQVKLTIQLLFIIYFMKTLFSMSYGDMSTSATFILGYCLAQEKKNEQVVYCN